MIKLVASDLDGTLLLNGATAASGRDFPIDQRTEKAWNTFCGGKRKTVSQHEKAV